MPHHLTQCCFLVNAQFVTSPEYDMLRSDHILQLKNVSDIPFLLFNQMTLYTFFSSHSETQTFAFQPDTHFHLMEICL